jgi:RNA polymerase sigma-70 factor (ECF subfamily)
VNLAVDTVVPAQTNASTAADSAGGRRVDYRLMAAVRPAIARYCRARLGRGDHAAEVARAVCRTVAARRPGAGDEDTLAAFVYRTASAAVNTAVTAVGVDAAGLPAQLALLPAEQREVLVLRVAVGLSVEQAAVALGATPDVVRHVQHQALQQLRTA